jgi:arylsulfatase A-like enzyme
MNLYDGSVRWLDVSFGTLLDRLRARPDWDRTVVVVVGDHGQGLGQHGHLGHGRVWLEHLHVPLFMRIPGVAPRREPVLMSMVDVLPTLLAAAPRLPAEGFLEQCRGANVLDANAPPQAVYGMSRPEHGLTTLIEDKWKYIRHEGESESLFDIEADPFRVG